MVVGVKQSQNRKTTSNLSRRNSIFHPKIEKQMIFGQKSKNIEIFRKTRKHRFFALEIYFWLSMMPPVGGCRQARVRFQSRLGGTGPINNRCPWGPPVFMAHCSWLLMTCCYSRQISCVWGRRHFKQPKRFVFSTVSSSELNLGVWGFLKWFLPWMCVEITFSRAE